MTQDEFRQECFRLFQCNSISDCNDLINIYTNFLYSVIEKHQTDKVNSTALAQAKLIPQMVFTKLVHLQSIIAGIHYENSSGGNIHGIIDPIVVGCQIRSTYELVSMFHMVYITPQTDDEKAILYNLWVHAGLAYRQRFTSVITTEENHQKQREELQIMEELARGIENTALYQSLGEKDQKKIQSKLKDKDYMIRFDNNQVTFLHWHNMIDVMGIKHGLLSDIYTYFSLYSHPSNVAIFQFGEMFKDGEEGFRGITAFHLKTLFVFVSVFVADYIQLFPNVIQTFNRMGLVEQNAIDFHNRYMRGYSKAINDAYKYLG
jgi:hypothetical protein